MAPPRRSLPLLELLHGIQDHTLYHFGDFSIASLPPFFYARPSPKNDLPPIYNLPLDIFECILHYLLPHDAVRLSRTCKAVYKHPSVISAIYRQLFDADDLEHSDYLRRICLKHGCRTPDPAMLAPSLDGRTGPMVRSIAMPSWMKADDLYPINRFCTNIQTLNLLRCGESIDCTSQGQNPPANDGFRFPPVLREYPDMFRNIKRLHLKYGRAGSGDPVPNTASHLLPVILDLTKNTLQFLELEFWWRENRLKRNHNGDLVPEPPAMRREMTTTLTQEVLENVSPKLTTLRLTNAPYTVHNFFPFLLSLETHPSLTTIEISLHADLYRIVNDRFFRSQSKMSNLTAGAFSNMDDVFLYVQALKYARERCRFQITAWDEGKHWIINPGRLSSALNRYHGEMLPLLKSIGWTPVFDWIAYYNVRAPRDQRDGPVQALLGGRMHSASKLFDWMRAAGIEVAVQLVPQKAGGFFADTWKPKVSEEAEVDTLAMTAACSERRPVRNRDAPTILNVFGTLGRSSGSNRLSPATSPPADYTALAPRRPKLPSPGSRQPIPSLFFGIPKKPGHYGVLTNTHLYRKESSPRIHIDPRLRWGLGGTCEQFNPCALISDLRIFYNELFPQVFEIYAHDHADPVHGPLDAPFIAECEQHLGKRLQQEAKEIAVVYRGLKMFPELMGLALFVPAALYPDCDLTFIEACLPGKGWRVSQLKSGGGEKRDQRSPNKAQRYLVAEICPFVERVFVRENARGCKSLRRVREGQVHRIKRPRVDLEGKGMEGLLRAKWEDEFARGRDWSFHAC